MQAILLAAGYATRMGALCENTPKPLLPIGGRPMIDHLMDRLAELPIDGYHVVTNHKFIDCFSQWRAGHPLRKRIAVHDDGTVKDDTKLGSIGDISFVLEHADIREDFLVAAGDNLFAFSLKPVYELFVRRTAPTLVAVKPSDRNVLKSWAPVRCDETGRVTWLKEKPNEFPDDIDIGLIAVYAYPAAIRAVIRRYLEEGNNPEAPGYLAEYLSERVAVYVHRADGVFIDIGTPDAYRAACAAHAGDSE